MKEIVWLRHIYAEDYEGHNIKDYNLNVFAGEIVCIFGFHGSGKRVIQSVLIGEIPILAGSIYLNEAKTSVYNADIAQKFGIVAIDIRQRLIPVLSIEENIFAIKNKKHVFSIFNEKAARHQLKIYLEQIQMISILDKKVDELTLFEEQMVAIAKALANDAKLIIINFVDHFYRDQDVEKLTAIMRSLTRSGVSFLVFCEKHNAIVSTADRVQYVQDGVDTFVYSQQQFNMLGAASGSNHTTAKTQETSNASIIGIIDLSWSTTLDFSEYWRLARLENNQFVNSIGDFTVGQNAYIISEDSAFTLIPTLDIINNVCAGVFPKISRLGIINKPVMDFIHREFCQETGINPDKKEIDELSYLERKLISIYRYELFRPQTLIFENPFFGMDIAGSQKLLEYLRSLAGKNIRLILFSNSLEELNRICDDVIITNNGKLTAAKNDTLYKKSPTIGTP